MAELDNRELHENIGLFSASISARPVSVQFPPLKTILLALDQSNQDSTAEALALSLAQRHQASLHLSYASIGEWHEDREAYFEERRQKFENAGVKTTCSYGDEGPPFAQILDICQAKQCDLMIFSAPYLRGLPDVGTRECRLQYRYADVSISRPPADCPCTQANSGTLFPPSQTSSDHQ